MDFWETLHASPQYWEVRKRFSQPTTSTMKNYQQHVTKGPVTAEPPNANALRHAWSVWPEERSGRARICTLTQGKGDEADATLIAEAFNVLHDTGFTPGELAEQAM